MYTLDSNSMPDSTPSPYIRFFGESEDVDVIGGKGVNLARMASAGLPVPPGFSLTSQAYRAHLGSSDLEGAINARLSSVDGADPAELATVCLEIQALISGAEVPEEVDEQARAAYRRLSQLEDNDGPIPVSVRSSATSEDSAGASFAGQHDTFLNVVDEGHVLEAVLGCWASLWSTHATMYRNTLGIGHLDVAMPVVVQKMVNATSSGVVFTANPVTGNAAELMINACWGLGEAVVSGIVTPDHIIVSKSGLSLVSSQISSKDVMIVRDGGQGTMRQPVPPAQANAPALSEDQLRMVCQTAVELEATYGEPQDIEFAFEQDRLSLLQTRPITTL